MSPQIEGVAYLLYLICIYESKNISLLDSIFNSTKRFFNKKYKLTFECDKTLLLLIGTLIRKPFTKNEKAEIIIDYVPKFKKLAKSNNTEKGRIEDLGLNYWLNFNLN